SGVNGSFLSLACKHLQFDSEKDQITLVLAEDGTIVEDEDYFLCLPPKTKFMVLTGNKKWAALNGGTAWMAQESVEAQDNMDGIGDMKWKALAAQLNENLSNIILMSESELQMLVEVPVKDLAEEVKESAAKVQVLQDTLQRLLDRREEERQSKQLLQLFLQALMKDETSDTSLMDSVSANRDEIDASKLTQSGPGGTALLSSSIIKTLREKELPHLSLSNAELEAVTSEDPEVLAATFNQDAQRATDLQSDCRRELENRTQQAQSLNSLAGISKKQKSLP
uniref:CIDE-N domain-containing protein n=1 Tax=Leptobrachium leishanense TaxID=445787 RepID=A0A8C5PMR9_9ANUR